MKFDDILGEIGEFGLYQKLVYYALCINGATTACHMLAQVFLAGHMPHSCKVCLSHLILYSILISMRRDCFSDY